MGVLYSELRALAAHFLDGLGAPHILQPTALVHEAYLRLARTGKGAWNDRSHFFSVAAMAMRQILVNHARTKRAQKRGGGCERVTLAEASGLAQSDDVDILALNDLLATLETLDARQARIVELRYFGGLTLNEIASLLNVSLSTVEKEWRMARLWLLSKLSG
jgi:RNA polymerase sigma-70 factor (ECF subfamily)